MLTIVESPLFSKLWPDYWTEDELGPMPGNSCPIPVAVARSVGHVLVWVSAVACA